MNYNAKEKIHVSDYMLSLIIALICICNSRHLGINYYLPVMIPAMSVFLIFLFVEKIKFRIEHFCALILILLTIIHLNDAIYYLAESKVIFSQTILIVFFILFTLSATNIRGLRLIANSFIFCSVVFSLMILFFPYAYDRYGHYSIATFLGEHQALDPNYLAACISIAATILVKRVIYHKQYKLFYIVLATLVLFGVLMTGSRMGMLSFILSFLVLILKDKKKIIFAFIVMSLLAVIILFVLPQDVQERLFYKSYIDSSNIKRIHLWQATVDKILEKPVIGHGAILTKLVISDDSVSGAAHNTFLMFLLNFGLLGFIAFIMIYLKIFILCLNKDMYLFLALFANISFSSFIISNNISIFFWAVLVFLTLAVNYKKNNPDTALWDKI